MSHGGYRPWRAAALAYALAALPYLALQGDSMFLYYAAALAAPVGWAFVLRAAWVASGGSRRVLWLLLPAGLAAVFPVLATGTLFAIWSVSGFGS